MHTLVNKPNKLATKNIILLHSYHKDLVHGDLGCVNVSSTHTQELRTGSTVIENLDFHQLICNSH